MNVPYVVILEKVGEQMETLEEELLQHPTRDTLLAIHGLKREMIYLRRQIWPLREMIHTITRGEFALVSEDPGILF